MKRFVPVVGLVWLVVVTGGLAALAKYKATPGPIVEGPRAWPGDTRLVRATHGPTLLMFAHPKCPCTRASLGELRVLLTELSGRAEAHVVFNVPTGTPSDWAQGELWRMATDIPGVRVERDEGGVEMRRFAAATSGHTMLFDADGHLLFEGGITSARGHRGDSLGGARLRALLSNEKVDRNDAPTFGCALAEPGEKQ